MHKCILTLIHATEPRGDPALLLFRQNKSRQEKLYRGIISVTHIREAIKEMNDL